MLRKNWWLVAPDYDPEAVVQEADIEMAEIEESSHRIAAFEKKHGCIHSAGGPKVAGEVHGEYVCRNCGKVFPSSEAMWAEYDRLIALAR